MEYSTVKRIKTIICEDCTAEKGYPVNMYETNDSGDFICPHIAPSQYNDFLFKGLPGIKIANKITVEYE